jgi:biopolymer transport protein ExbD
MRKTPEIPSASLADIAFLLLIFFLTSASMDTDRGLERRLPPMAPDVENKDTPPVKERNVFIVLVNKDNQLLVEGEWLQIGQLREKAKEFMENPNDTENLPEKELKTVDFFGEIPVSKGIISLQNDLGTQYGTYLAVQNELVAAINELREELARSKFGEPLAKLSKEKQDAIRDIYPQRISEAEPKRVGEK